MLRMPPDNETVVRRYFAEVANGRLLDLADELFTADAWFRDPHSPPTQRGPQGVKETLRIYQESLEGYWDVQELLSSGDRVVAHWIGRGTHVRELMGIPPTGREIAMHAITLFRVRDGRIAGAFTVWDALTMLQQLGVLEAAAIA